MVAQLRIRQYKWRAQLNRPASQAGGGRGAAAPSFGEKVGELGLYDGEAGLYDGDVGLRHTQPVKHAIRRRVKASSTVYARVSRRRGPVVREGTQCKNNENQSAMQRVRTSRQATWGCVEQGKVVSA